MRSEKKIKAVLAITGASGAIYSRVLLEKLVTMNRQIEELGIVLSDNAKLVWKQETGKSFSISPYTGKFRIRTFEKKDFFAPFASGSADFNLMVICPCSMGTLGRIAGGISDDLITRAADVFLKERRKLILVTRETPLSLIHINNMKTVTEAGGIICPATPSFYSKPKTFEQLASTVTDRILDLSGMEHKTFRWKRGYS